MTHLKIVTPVIADVTCGYQNNSWCLVQFVWGLLFLFMIFRRVVRLLWLRFDLTLCCLRTFLPSSISIQSRHCLVVTSSPYWFKFCLDIFVYKILLWMTAWLSHIALPWLRYSLFCFWRQSPLPQFPGFQNHSRYCFANGAATWMVIMNKEWSSVVYDMTSVIPGSVTYR